MDHAILHGKPFGIPLVTKVCLVNNLVESCQQAIKNLSTRWGNAIQTLLQVQLGGATPCRGPLESLRFDLLEMAGTAK
jgi:hypothetical protein